MHERYFAERGVAYRVNDLRPERRTLLFLHGLSGSISAWYPYEPLFSRGYNMITVDLRGHGYSKRWPTFEEYELDRFAKDVITLLAHLKIERVTIVAHSFGTLIALRMAQKAPQLIEAAVLLAPNFNLYTLVRTQISLPFIALVADILSLVPRQQHHGRVNYEPLRGGGDWDPRRIIPDVGTTGLHSYFWSLLHIDRFASTDWSALSMPTLILHGARDEMVPVKRGIQLAKALPHAKLVILSHGTHMLVNNYIKDVAMAVNEFLTATG